MISLLVLLLAAKEATAQLTVPTTQDVTVVYTSADFTGAWATPKLVKLGPNSKLTINVDATSMSTFGLSIMPIAGSLLSDQGKATWTGATAGTLEPGSWGFGTETAPGMARCFVGSTDPVSNQETFANDLPRLCWRLARNAAENIRAYNADTWFTNGAALGSFTATVETGAHAAFLHVRLSNRASLPTQAGFFDSSGTRSCSNSFWEWTRTKAADRVTDIEDGLTNFKLYALSTDFTSATTLLPANVASDPAAIMNYGYLSPTTFAVSANAPVMLMTNGVAATHCLEKYPGYCAPSSGTPGTYHVVAVATDAAGSTDAVFYCQMTILSASTCPDGTTGSGNTAECSCPANQCGSITFDPPSNSYLVSTACAACECPLYATGTGWTTGSDSGCVCSTEGFPGTITWNVATNQYDGACEPVPAPDNVVCTGSAGGLVDFAGAGNPCTCAPGFSGTITWDSGTNTYSGTCTPGTCAPYTVGPEDHFTVVETTLSAENFYVEVNCATDRFRYNDFCNNGTSFLKVCDVDGGPYTITNDGCCELVRCEGQPYTGTAGACTCARGYKGTASVVNGVLGGCVPIDACVAPAVWTGYKLVDETNTRGDIFEVYTICDDGYEGLPLAKACTTEGGAYELTGCVPFDCTAPELDSAYVVTEVDLTWISFDATATCADGYIAFGAGPKVNKCSAQGGTYWFEGCQLPITCTSPDKTGYLVTETTLTVNNWDVTAACNTPNYVGDAVVIACQQQSTDYELVGCAAGTCDTLAVNPSATNIVNNDLSMPTFDVAVSCQEDQGYGGTVTAVACTTDREAYTLTGSCEPYSCSVPADTSGYVLVPYELYWAIFDVVVEGCEPKYVANSPTATKCTGGPDSPYQLSGCTPIPDVCTSPDKTGYTVVETELKLFNFQVTASCAPGFAPSGDVVVTECASDGQAYSLSGCVAVPVCVAPADKTGYNVTETDLTVPNFSVEAYCKLGYDGTGTANPCTTDGEAYTLTGCAWVPMCASPADKTGYVTTETDLRVASFYVPVACASGYEGSAAVTACASEGQAYTLSGCTLSQLCLAPADKTGYIVTETDLRVNAFDVTAGCASGYEGTVSVSACASKDTAYTLSGCTPAAYCLAPASKTGYTVTETNLIKSNFALSVTCADGYEGTPNYSVCETADTPYSLSGCTLIAYCSAPDKTGYTVTETNLRKSQFDLTVTCASGYQGSPSFAVCATADAAYTLSGCTPIPRCVAPSKTGYVVTETDLRMYTLSLTVTCATGYEGTPAWTICPSHGTAYTLSGCAPIAYCTAPASTVGYTVTETSLRKSNFDVTAACATGYEGSATATVCASADAAYALSGCTAIAYCVAPASATGYTVTETDLRVSNFVLAVACAGGYEGTATSAVCSSAGTAYTLSGCTLSVGAEVCAEPASKTGYAVVETDLRLATFDLTVTCATGYEGSPAFAVCTTKDTAYTLSGCNPISYCTAPTSKTGYSVIETDLRVSNFALTVTCAGGYEGTATSAVCLSAGTAYTLSGCAPVAYCVAPDKTGYDVVENDLRKSSFDVSPSCADGYTGSVTWQACASAGGAYILGGCNAIESCIAPASKVGYMVSEDVMRIADFALTVTCQAGFEGSPSYSVCDSAGTAYTLSGCSPIAYCTAPSKDGYTVTETNLRKSNFVVTVACDSGWTGTAAAAVCASADTPYTLSGCAPIEYCVAPASKTGYTVTETDLRLSNFALSVTCATGYEGTATATVCATKDTAYTLGGCTPIPTCLVPVSKVGYTVSETSLSISDFSVQVECANGFEGTATVAACASDGMVYTLSGCTPKTYCVTPTKTGYTVVESSLLISTFGVTASCSGGYATTTSAAATVCAGNGMEYTLSGCQPITCQAPASLAGYAVTETSLTQMNFQVDVTCQDGHVSDSPAASACTGTDVDGGEYTVAGCAPIVCLIPSEVDGVEVLPYLETVPDDVALTWSTFDVRGACPDPFEGQVVIEKCNATYPYFVVDVSGCTSPPKLSAGERASAFGAFALVLVHLAQAAFRFA